jgi:hypothetical protein
MCKSERCSKMVAEEHHWQVEYVRCFLCVAKIIAVSKQHIHI